MGSNLGCGGAGIFGAAATGVGVFWIGAGAFWTGMIDLVGGKPAEAVATDIQKSWDAIK